MDLRITLPKASPDLWSSRPNLMGHQSPNPPQPAQWISATRIRSHPGPSQRGFRPTNCKSEAASLGPRPAWVYPWPQVKWPYWPDRVPSGKWNSSSREGERGRPTRKDQHGQTHDDPSPFCVDKDEPKNIWRASQQVAVARAVSLAKVGPASLERGGEERDRDRNRQTWMDRYI